MRISRATSVAMLVFVLITSFGVAGAPSQGPAERWLSYLFATFKTNASLRAGVQHAAASQADPGLRAFMAAIAPALSDEAIVAKVHPMVEAALTPQELDRCAAFAVSPTGKAVLATTQRYPTFEAALPALTALPVEHQERSRTLFSSPCYVKTMAVLSSAQFQETMVNYGKELACAEFSRSQPEVFAMMRRDGHCKG